MAQTGYTPISIYYSATASNTPTAGNLVAGELAINTADGKLFYKDSAGAVQVIGTKGGVGSSTTTQVLYNSSGLVVGSSNLIFNGTQLGVGRTPTTYAIEASGVVASYSGSNTFQLQASGNDGYINLTGTGSTIFRTGSGPLETMRIDASGNVGIGTASPAVKLDTVGNIRSTFNSNLYLSATTPTTGGVSGKLTSSDNNLELIADSTSSSTTSLIFKTSASGTTAERMRIDSSGNLLVGSTTVGTTNSNSFTITTASGAYSINHASGTASGSYYCGIGYGGTLIGSITQVGTTAVLFNTTSDYRLKTDVKPIQNALSTIEALNPVSFTWVDGRPDDGFIAHEIQAVIPNCVTGEKDAVNEDGTPHYQQMDNSGVIPFLVKAIQELNAKVTALETQLAAKG